MIAIRDNSKCQNGLSLKEKAKDSKFEWPVTWSAYRIQRFRTVSHFNSEKTKFSKFEWPVCLCEYKIQRFRTVSHSNRQKV